MAITRKQISITEEDQDLITYYQTEGKGNESKFILNCIRYYKDNEEIREKKIREIVEECLKNKNIELTYKKSPIDEKVKKSMLSVMDMD